MLSLEKCKILLKNEHVKYTDTEIEELTKYLSALAELEISIRKQNDD